MAISRRLRFEILRRDNYTCRYCGGVAPEVRITVDHVVPRALGGTDDPSNLVAACADCNGGKSASSPDEAVVAAVREDAARWNIAMQRAIEQRSMQLAEQRERLEWFDKLWSSWGCGEGADRISVPKGGGWERTIMRFLASGLSESFIEDAISIAMEARHVAFDGKWRYFCGICWNEINTLQKMATELLSQASSQVDELSSRGSEAPWAWAAAAAGFYLDKILNALGVDSGKVTIVRAALRTGLADGAQVYRESVEGGGERAGEAYRACFEPFEAGIRAVSDAEE
jgi:hypothetical protein